MQTAFTIVVVLLAILYVLSIVWVIRDAYMRGTTWYIWAAVSLVPLVGVIAYLLLRPPLLKIDRDEQELEILLKQRQLMNYGECASCGYPVDANYVVCPSCHTQLKNLCTHCQRALEPAWSLCPFCATPVAGANVEINKPRRQSSSSSSSGSSARPSRSSARSRS